MVLYKWKKKPNTGAHYFKWLGKKYSTRPGDTVICPIDAMGSFHEEYECVAEVVDGKEQPISDCPVLEHIALEQEAIAQPSDLKVIHKGFGRYYVINPDNPDSPLNDKAMSKEEAEKFLGYLNE
jgi:hypothetical protein